MFLSVCTDDVITYSVGNYLGSETLPQDIDTIFNFKDNTDQLVVVDNSKLDRETLSSYRFEVVATDTQAGDNTATVTVTLTDVNDNPPMITSPP